MSYGSSFNFGLGSPAEKPQLRNVKAALCPFWHCSTQFYAENVNSPKMNWPIKRMPRRIERFCD